MLTSVTPLPSLTIATATHPFATPSDMQPGFQALSVRMSTRDNHSAVSIPSVSEAPPIWRRNLHVQQHVTQQALQDARRMTGHNPAIQKRRLPSTRVTRRALSPTHTPNALLADDVVTIRLPDWSYRTNYELPDIFTALAQITRPGQQLALLVEQIYNAGNSHALTSQQRDVLLTAGAIFDLISVTVPGVMAMKMVGTVSDLVSKALRDEPITAADVLDLNSTFRNVMDMRLHPDHTSVKSIDEIPPESVARRHSLNNPDFITQLYFRKSFPPRPDKREPISSAAAEKLPAKSQAELPGKPDTIEIASDIQVAAKSITVSLNGADEAQSQAEQPPRKLSLPLTVPRVHVAAAPSRKIPLLDGSRQPPLKPLAPLLYAAVDGIPVLPRRNDAGQYAWHELDRSWYEIRVLQPDTRQRALNRAIKTQAQGDQLFTIGDQDYVTIDAHSYAIRDLSPTALQVFNPFDVSLPSIPVEKWRGTWRFKPLTPVAVPQVDPRIGSDGYIRVNNERYLVLDGIVVATDHAYIMDESLIARAAFPIHESLPGADACGFIQWNDEKIVIEGRDGYYLIRHDPDAGMVVVHPDGTQRFSVFYDFQLGQWHAGSPHSNVARERQLHQRQIIGASPGSQNGDLQKSALRHPSNEVARAPSPPRRRMSLEEWRRIDSLPFASHWPTLASAVTKTLRRLSDTKFERLNRRDPSIVRSSPLMSISDVRAAAYRLMPSPKEWNGLSVLAKQQRAAEYTTDVYKNFFFLWEREGAEVMCTEMTELAMADISRTLRPTNLPGLPCIGCANEEQGTQLLAVQFKENVPVGNTGRAHVMLMAFKSRETMEAGFGPVSSPASADMGTLREMQNGEFQSFVSRNVNEMVLIDPWGPNKVIDFSSAGGIDSAADAIHHNLREASFGDFTATIGFSVKPFVPPLSGTRTRHVRPVQHPDAAEAK